MYTRTPTPADLLVAKRLSEKLNKGAARCAFTAAVAKSGIFKRIQGFKLPTRKR